MGETEVEVDGLNIIVIPYDIITEDGSLCAQSPQVFTHTASIRVDEPGTANLIVKGRQDFGGDVVTFERQLEVK